MDLNGKRAAIRAGYSAKTAESQASRLLRNVKVSAVLRELQSSRLKRLELDADGVLKSLAELVDADIVDCFEHGTYVLRPLDEISPSSVRNGVRTQRHGPEPRSTARAQVRGIANVGAPTETQKNAFA